MSIPNISTAKAEEILKLLGPDPHPDAILEYARSELGHVTPTILDFFHEYEYVVTVKDYDIQDNFYDEMESLGTRGFVPKRKVECASRNPIGRSTHYYISPFEAAKLKQDPRVQAVEPHPSLLGHVVKPLGAEFSNGWDKSGTITSNMNNWGLLRCTNNTQIANWGSDGTPNQIGTIYTTSAGQYVDCVVFDGNILPGHPEYAVNSDGTGGSRVEQINWWAYNPEVTGDPAGNYDYNAGVAGNNGHGMHVAGIMAGNSQGWAKNSLIYNISPYGEQTNGTATPSLAQLVNYIRYWHRNKPINPATGRPNPTVVNMSFGISGSNFPQNGILYSDLFVYRGVQTNMPASPPAGQTTQQNTYNANWTVADWLAGGVQLYKDYADALGIVLYFYTVQDAAVEAAIIDGANEGIIWVAAAGNQYNEAGYQFGEADFDNYLNYAYLQIFTFIYRAPRYHNRLATPASSYSGTPGNNNYKTVISVGNIGSTVDQSLSLSSSSGTKVTIWAPGTDIMSAYNAAGVADPRNAAYYITKLTGTSMAAPQVSGVLACVASQIPNLNQQTAISYIQSYAQPNVIPDPNTPLPGPTVSYYNLRGAPNLFLGYNYNRPVSGNPWPQERFYTRPTSGQAYPRQIVQLRPISGAT